MKDHRSLYSRIMTGEIGTEKKQKLPKNASQITHNFQSFNVKGLCYFCNSTLRKNETDSHILSFHMKATYNCKDCGVEKLARSSLYAHIKEVHITTNVPLTETIRQCFLQSCGLCEYKDEPSQFSKHIKEHEQELLETKYAYKNCFFCDFKHVSQRRLETHFAKIHNIKPFNCDVCEFRSKTKQGMIDHYKLVHPEYKYKCRLCRFESSHFPALSRHHQDIHEDAKYHKCHKCSARFKRNEFLQIHIKTVHK